MKDITKLDPDKISDNGFYIDVFKSSMFHLTDAEIKAARKYFNMPQIACERNIRKYVPTSSNSYQKGKNLKKGLSRGVQRMLFIGGVTISLTVFSVALLSNDVKGEYADLSQFVSPIQIVEKEEEIPQIFVEEVAIEENVENLTEEDSQRKEWVRKYCDIYQVDFERVYNKLLQLTDDFTSELYLNGSIPNVTCKGETVYCDNEEALILYFVRCAKQVPERFDLSRDGLYIKSEYYPEGTYTEQIRYYGNLLEVDPALAYSIVQAETSWNSDNFLNLNNPAGLKNEDGTWWVFSTKEEGFIELYLEILKYNRLGAYTIEEIGSIHAPEEDGNENWIPNVRATYQEVSQSLFSVVKVSEEENTANRVY